MRRTNLKPIRVRHWIKRIDEMLERPDYKWAWKTLKGIRRTIEENKVVTENQIQALKNIRWGKNEIDD